MAEFLPLNNAEQNNDTAWYTAAASGIASGLLKIPEGVFSLGAEKFPSVRFQPVSFTLEVVFSLATVAFASVKFQPVSFTLEVVFSLAAVEFA